MLRISISNKILQHALKKYKKYDGIGITGKKSMGHPLNHCLAGEMMFMGQHGTAGKN